MLLTLARLGVYFDDVEPVNSPDSSRRLIQAPRDVDVELLLEDGVRQVRYPRNTGELTAAAALRVEASASRERIRAIRDLAWWTAVCPNYAPFTIPRLAGALQDTDPGVKGAAAVSLGSVGSYGAAAVPDLLAARGSTVSHFDYLVDEAVLLIQNTPRWPGAPECEDASVTELQSRSRRTRSIWTPPVK
jgi:hypothetical protein